MSAVSSSTQSLGSNRAICTDTSVPAQEFRDIQRECLRLVKIQFDKIRDLQKLQILLITKSTNGEITIDGEIRLLMRKAGLVAIPQNGTTLSNLERLFLLSILQIRTETVHSIITFMHHEVQPLFSNSDNN